MSILTKNTHIRRSNADTLFDAFVLVVMILFLLICLYPLYFVLIASVSDPVKVSAGKVLLFPNGFTLDGYARIFRYQKLWIGYRNTPLLHNVGYHDHVSSSRLWRGTHCLARNLRGRRPFLLLFSFTMFFSGGMIPTYMVVNGLG
jgi:putative aldouronate transport system permease protein